MRYGPDQIHRLIFAVELFEFGVSPATVLSLVEALWTSRLHRIFRKAEDAAQRDPGQDDVILHMGGVSMMSDGWSNEIPNVNSCALAKLHDYIDMWMEMGTHDRLPARALVVNLSSRLRRFHSALAAALEKEPS